ncbi:MAG: flippase-like domain-containing protein [Ktedonobacteraceae bacterium]|nr:flippase-like domain-containing protein [Ktedonobacteraceae bacterium]
MSSHPAASSKTEQEQQQESNLRVSQAGSRSIVPGKTRHQWLKLFLRTGVTLLLFALLLKSVSWSTVLTTLLHAQRAPLLLGLAAGVLCVIFSSWSWHSLVRAEGMQIDLARLIKLYLVGMAFSHFLPTSIGGDIARAYYAGKEGGSLAGAASSVLMSRIAGFLGMLLIALPTLLIWRSTFAPLLVLGFLMPSLFLLIAIGGTIVAAPLLPHISPHLLKRRQRLQQLLTTALNTGQMLGATARRPRVLTQAVCFGALFWLASFLNYYGYALALGIDAPLHFYVIAISFSSLIAFFPVSLNGFGLKEGTLVFAFASIHVSPTVSLPLALLMDCQVLFFGLIGAGIYLAMERQK